MHDFVAAPDGTGYSSSFAPSAYPRGMQQPQQHTPLAPAASLSRRPPPDLFTNSPLAGAGSTSYSSPYYAGPYAGGQQQVSGDDGAVFGAPYGQFEAEPVVEACGSEEGGAPSFSVIPAPGAQVGAQQPPSVHSTFYEGAWHASSAGQPPHSSPYARPPPLHRPAAFRPYAPYAPYTSYPAPYNHSSSSLPYNAPPPSVEHPSPSQIGELYQPAHHASAPLVPTLDGPVHDQNTFPFPSSTHPHSFTPFSPSYPPPPPPPPHIADQSSIPFPPNTDADAVPGPSSLSQQFADADLNGGGGRIETPSLSAYHPASNSGALDGSPAVPTPPGSSLSRSSSTKGKGKERDMASFMTTTSPMGRVEEVVHVPAMNGLKRRRLPKDAASRKYVCQECDQRFARPSALATHILTHTKEKPFICLTCDRGFAVMSNLRRHCRVRNHTLAPSQESHIRTRGTKPPPIETDLPAGVRHERFSIDSNASSSASSTSGSSSGGNGSGGPHSHESTPLMVPVLPPVMEAGGGAGQRYEGSIERDEEREVLDRATAAVFS
ncbi:hypothetical protein JCM6882_004635 [Rhodosporidiobolus microsporus]